MSSKLLYHRKWILEEDELIEVKAWKVPVSKNYPEGIKYSLVYIRKGRRILAYDNYQGHGHHRHYFGKTEPYQFINLERLIKDFWKDFKEVKVFEGKEPKN